jgi:hypothetical protein
VRLSPALIQWLALVGATFVGGLLSGGVLWAIATWFFRAKRPADVRLLRTAITVKRDRERGPYRGGA